MFKIILGLSLEEVKKYYILTTYKDCNNNAAKTARTLKVGRTTLYRRLKEYGIRS